MYKTETLSEEELYRYLRKIRRISKMDDGDAIDELNELIHKFITNRINTTTEPDMLSSGDEKTDRKIDYLRKYIEECKTKLEGKNIDMRSAGYIRSHVDMFYSEYLNKSESVINDLLNDVLALADKTEEEASIIYINEFNKTKLRYMDSILNFLDEAETCLKRRNSITEVLASRILSIKTDCAWYRANKAIAEADVAKGGGNDKKYNRLIGEAQVMLKQDWSRILPDIPVPSIL